jgi:hypothetical protein
MFVAGLACRYEQNSKEAAALVSPGGDCREWVSALGAGVLIHHQARAVGAMTTHCQDSQNKP